MTVRCNKNTRMTAKVKSFIKPHHHSVNNTLKLQILEGINFGVLERKSYMYFANTCHISKLIKSRSIEKLTINTTIKPR